MAYMHALFYFYFLNVFVYDDVQHIPGKVYSAFIF